MYYLNIKRKRQPFIKKLSEISTAVVVCMYVVEELGWLGVI